MEQGRPLRLDAVVNVKYRFIYEDVDRHGNVRIFLRGKGHKKVRVHDRVGSPTFHTRYAQLMQREEQALTRRACRSAPPMACGRLRQLAPQRTERPRMSSGQCSAG